MSGRPTDQATRASRRSDDALEPWNPRENEAASAARFFGILALLGPVSTWAYVGLIAARDHQTSHGQRYLLQLLSSVSDLLLVPAAIAVVLGLAAVLRRGVGRRWRRRALLGLVFGIVAITATALRLALASS